MQIYAVTHRGKKRDVNQDAYYADNDKGIFVVADGMGGYKAGDVASKMAIDEVIKHMEDTPSEASLKRAILKANHAVYLSSHEEPSYSGMGTTMTLCCHDHDKWWFAQVGDSRAYLYRDGKLEQITHDHSLVQALLDSGSISEEESKKHPERHVITRAIGTSLDIDVDAFERMAYDEDIILLCSDGLLRHVDDEEIRKVLSSIAIENVADHLLALTLERGASDNVTILVTKLTGGPAHE